MEVVNNEPRSLGHDGSSVILVVDIIKYKWILFVDWGSKGNESVGLGCHFGTILFCHHGNKFLCPEICWYLESILEWLLSFWSGRPWLIYRSSCCLVIITFPSQSFFPTFQLQTLIFLRSVALWNWWFGAPNKKHI
jgi:hypothetical protein